jgi:hypothetical protein
MFAADASGAGQAAAFNEDGNSRPTLGWSAIRQ